MCVQGVVGWHTFILIKEPGVPESLAVIFLARSLILRTCSKVVTESQRGIQRHKHKVESALSNSFHDLTRSCSLRVKSSFGNRVEAAKSLVYLLVEPVSTFLEAADECEWPVEVLVRDVLACDVLHAQEEGARNA